jgi:ABC-2 type transport system permease protein
VIEGVEPTQRIRRYASSLYGLLLRDLRVQLRDGAGFVLRAIMNPLFFLFIFAFVFPRTGQGFSGGGTTFATILVPGLVGVAIFFQGVAAVALPLAMELGGTREIEDRLMAPVPVALVAIEKILFSAMLSVISAAMVFPLAWLLPGIPVEVTVASWPLLAAVVLLGSLAGGALGLFLGTSVRPRQIGLMFSLVVIPITFLGCVYYPWARLDAVPWLQWAVLLDPLVYVSEGLRAALTPEVGHMPAPAFLGAIGLSLVVLTWAGVRGFLRRTIS